MNDLPSLPRRARAFHCQDQAARLREIAGAEDSSALRERLLTLADEYQKLADDVKVAWW